MQKLMLEVAMPLCMSDSVQVPNTLGLVNPFKQDAYII